MLYINPTQYSISYIADSVAGRQETSATSEIMYVSKNKIITQELLKKLRSDDEGKTTFSNCDWTRLSHECCHFFALLLRPQNGPYLFA